MVCRFAVQRESSALAGSPSVNRDVGTTGPVYISSVLTGTSPPGTGGHSRNSGHMHRHSNVKKISLVYCYAGRWLAQHSQTDSIFSLKSENLAAVKDRKEKMNQRLSVHVTIYYHDVIKQIY